MDQFSCLGDSQYECSHTIVERGSCQECGWTITSFDKSASNDEYDSNLHSEYVSVLEKEINAMDLEPIIRDSVIRIMRQLPNVRGGSRRQIMYSHIFLAHLEHNYTFDSAKWIKAYQSKRRDAVAPLKIASGLNGYRVCDSIAEVVVLSPELELNNVLVILDLTSHSRPICRTIKWCLAKNSELYEENPKRTAVAFVKYYAAELNLCSVSNMPRICNVTPSIVNSIVKRIKATIAEFGPMDLTNID
jgi:hypothetical protein